MYEQGIEVGGIDFFASRGYIVVVVNPRGIQNSEGIWTGVLSRQDQIDCCEVIRWAGHYLSDGNVGMIGCGYAGKIQPLGSVNESALSGESDHADRRYRRHVP
ncbi:MAG: CocE/NonD family hydrolase [[Clostridium] scindens]